MEIGGTDKHVIKAKHDILLLFGLNTIIRTSRADVFEAKVPSGTNATSGTTVNWELCSRLLAAFYLSQTIIL